jgi:hypothetical protein
MPDTFIALSTFYTCIFQSPATRCVRKSAQKVRKNVCLHFFQHTNYQHFTIPQQKTKKPPPNCAIFILLPLLQLPKIANTSPHPTACTRQKHLPDVNFQPCC